MTLHEGARLSVVVTDSADRPIPGALIEISGRVLPRLIEDIAVSTVPCGTAVAAVHVARTGSRGEARFSGLSQGKQSIRITKPGWTIIDMTPPEASAPGEITVQMACLYAAGIALRNGVALAVRIEGAKLQPVLSDECSLVGKRLEQKHGLVWWTIGLEMTPSAIDLQHLPVASVLVEGLGWQRATIHVQRLETFVPDVIEVPADAQRIASGEVVVVDADGHLAKYRSIMEAKHIRLVPSGMGAPAQKHRGGWGVRLSIGDKRLLPVGKYSVEVDGMMEEVLAVTPKEIDVLQGGAVRIEVNQRTEFNEIALRLEDADGHEYSTGGYRLIPRSGGKARAAFVFNGWTDVRLCLPFGSYDAVLQGSDGSEARQEMVIGPADPHEKPTVYSLKASVR